MNRIHCLVTVRLRTCFPYWLSAGGMFLALRSGSVILTHSILHLQILPILCISDDFCLFTNFKFLLRVAPHFWYQNLLVFYCCVIDYHKFSGLEQLPFIISQFSKSNVQIGLHGFSAQGLTRLNSNHQLGWALTLRL